MSCYHVSSRRWHLSRAPTPRLAWTRVRIRDLCALQALGDVIAALTAKQAHVPFRNSTLTWLLSDSLGKDNKALMFAQVGLVYSF